MNTTVVIIVVVIVVAVVAAAVVARTTYQHTRLRRRFGSEYDRTLRRSGNRREAEQELRDREQRINRMNIRPLDEATQDRYLAGWAEVQREFVDTPAEAVAHADTLVEQVMADRGYPTGDFDQQADDLSVDHGRILGHYRTAHAVATRSAAGEASTEDLRQAVVHYRTLFDDLLGTGDRAGATVGQNEQNEQHPTPEQAADEQIRPTVGRKADR